MSIESHKKWAQLMHEIALELCRDEPDHSFVNLKLAQASRLSQESLDNYIAQCYSKNVPE